MNIEQRIHWAKTNPSDIAEHVQTLIDLSKGVASITEFGVRGGVSTTAWLAHPHDSITCYDRNVPDNLQELVGLALEKGTDFEFHTADTTQVKIEETDLLFIDATHDEASVRAELKNNHEAVTSTIILHDTELFGWFGENHAPGILHALMDFLLDNPIWRVTAHYPNNNGLTVLSRRPFEK